VADKTALLSLDISICNPDDHEECLYEFKVLNKLPLPIPFLNQNGTLDWKIGTHLY